MSEVVIRQAHPDDAGGIAAIYGVVVETSVTSFELVAPSEYEMRSRITRVVPRHPWLVAEAGDAIAGYAYAAQWNERPAYDWTVEVSVYVGDDFRGRGIGSALLDALLAELDDRGFVNAVARIALPNDASVRLFEARGFEPMGIARGIGYKLGRWVDVGQWQRRLEDAPADPS